MRNWKTLLIVLVTLSACGSAQTRPTPFVALGANAFDVVGGSAVGGLDWQPASFLRTTDEAGYETGGKDNDNANTSSRGHDRYLRGEALVLFKGWGVGPGVSWSKLYTPAYSKTHVHPKLLVQVPRSPYWSRLEVAYVHPGTDWQNSVQGFEASSWWMGKHAFLRLMVGGYWAHTTITAPDDPVLTAKQKAQHIPTSQAQIVMGWRF